MKLKALTVVTFVFVLVLMVTGTLFYDRISDPVPTHFTLQAEPDGFTSKPVGVFMAPAAVALLGFLFLVLPRIAHDALMTW